MSAIVLEKRGQQAWITLNRPDAHITLSPGLLDGLGKAYRLCDADDSIRVVVVTGAGSLFCAGADMSAGGGTFDGHAIAGEIDSCPLAMQAWEVMLAPPRERSSWRMCSPLMVSAASN